MSQTNGQNNKPKLGARMIRAFFVGNLIGILLFVVLYLGGGIITSLAANAGASAIASLPAVDWGLFGWIAGVSASIGIELSKDLEA